MATNKLKLFIRKIVREEVAMAIHEVITELKQPAEKLNKPVIEETMSVKQQYTSNTVLNDVLNETADTIDWSQMNESTHQSPAVTIDPETAAGMQIPQNVAANADMSFMNKDYGAILKKSYEKRK